MNIQTRMSFFQKKNMTPQHSRLIILDFDHTVFHTTKFVAALKEKLSSNFNIDEQKFTASRNHIKECNKVIDINKFVDDLPHHDKKGLHTAIVELITTHAKDWIFEDVRNFMKRHQKYFDIAIMTHGDQELQTHKMKHSNLPEPFYKVISTESKGNVISQFTKDYSTIFFVDDKLQNIQDVKKNHPKVQTIFIARPEDKPYADSCPTCSGADIAVESLEFDIPYA